MSEAPVAAARRRCGPNHDHTPHIFTAGFGDEEPESYHRRYAEMFDGVMDDIAAICAKAAQQGEANASGVSQV